MVGGAGFALRSPAPSVARSSASDTSPVTGEAGPYG
jgi:hypothetical protein